MLDDVSNSNIKVKTNAFNVIKELPRAIELAHSGKMQGKAVIFISNYTIKDEKNSRPEMV